MNWYIDAWKRYAQFSGRSSRKAFWMFFLVNSLVTLCFVALEISFQMTWKVEAIYSLLIFLPMLSLTVRRLQDSNRSAWWLLLVLLPGIGMVVLLVLLAMPSETPIDSIDYQPNNPNL